MPPSSSEVFFSIGPVMPAMRRPTALLPVKLIALVPGWRTMASPTFGPSPFTTFSTPAGKPISAASAASIVAVRGVTSDGLATTVLPAARAGAIFQVNRYSGRFHGLMQPTTPSGRRRV